jgi:predicted DNA-binding transcriptional regulator AlpA
MTVLLRTAEVSGQTGIPVATLRWWRHRGEGPPSFKLGKKTVVYPEDALAVWVSSQRAATTRGDVR